MPSNDTRLEKVAPSTRAAVSSLRGRPGDEAGLRAAWAQRRIYAHGTFVGMAVQARSCHPWTGKCWTDHHGSRDVQQHRPLTMVPASA